MQALPAAERPRWSACWSHYSGAFDNSDFARFKRAETKPIRAERPHCNKWCPFQCLGYAITDLLLPLVQAITVSALAQTLKKSRTFGGPAAQEALVKLHARGHVITIHRGGSETAGKPPYDCRELFPRSIGILNTEGN